MHAYAYCKVQPILHLTSSGRAVLASIMVLMICAPLLIHFLNKRELELAARLTAYTGYIWMGFLFLFCTVFAAADIYNLLMGIGGIITRSDVSRFTLPGKNSSFLLAMLVLIIGWYSLFDAQRIRTERITLATSKLPTGVSRLTIVHISDVHLNLTMSRRFLNRVMAAIREAEPDLLISTGDFVDVEVNHVVDLADLFQQIKPRYGKFAVMGNHDFYAGITEATLAAHRAGFKVLRGEGLTVAGIVNIAGIDDQIGSHLSRTASGPHNETALLAALPRNLFTILLKHRPDINEASCSLFDLQLSGHTHGGQLFPFTWVIHFLYPRQNGLYKLSGHSLLYTSTGTGTWGPPMRFLVPPKITVIEIKRQEEKGGSSQGQWSEKTDT